MNVPFLDVYLGRYLKAADNGDFFRRPLYWLYLVLGWVNVLIPLFIFFYGGSKLLDLIKGEYLGVVYKVLSMVVFFIALVVSVMVAYLGVVFWKDRAMRMRNITQMQSEFFVLPVWVHLIRSAGEWNGLLIAIGFTTFGVGSFLLGVCSAFEVNYKQLEALGLAFLSLVGFPVLGVLLGYLTVFLYRIIAESINVFLSMATNLSTIRNDTRNIASRQ